MSPDRPRSPAPGRPPEEPTRYAERALEALRTAGLRVTRPRRSVVELLERSSVPLTAAAIHEELKHRRVSVDPASVYRTLAVLAAHGLIHRLVTVEGVVRCEAGFENSACHHHLVCRRCHRVREVACDRPFEAASLGARAAGFRVDAHEVELVGLCADCAAAE